MISRAINGCNSAATKQYFAESDPTIPTKQFKLIKDMQKQLLHVNNKTSLSN